MPLVRLAQEGVCLVTFFWTDGSGSLEQALITPPIPPIQGVVRMVSRVLLMMVPHIRQEKMHAANRMSGLRHIAKVHAFVGIGVLALLCMALLNNKEQAEHLPWYELLAGPFAVYLKDATFAADRLLYTVVGVLCLLSTMAELLRDNVWLRILAVVATVIWYFLGVAWLMVWA